MREWFVKALSTTGILWYQVSFNSQFSMESFQVYINLLIFSWALGLNTLKDWREDINQYVQFIFSF